MNPSTIEILGTVFFALAVVHTFFTSKFMQMAHHSPKDSLSNQWLHLLGEIEVVFGLWGALFMLVYIFIAGWEQAINYQQSLHFVEPFFVFAIMVVCATRPILTAARQAIYFCSQWLQKIFRTPEKPTDLFAVLFLGPLSGSFITEPAAMTVTALLLNSMLGKNSYKLLYVLIAVLFVNVSIGGALTPFAAPPILMVAKNWGWDFQFTINHFGWKSAIAVFINTIGFLYFFRKELQTETFSLKQVIQRLSANGSIPAAVVAVHLLFLIGIVLTGHYQNAFLGIFLLFLGVASVTRKYQDSLRIRESLLVSLFLGGIIVFGAFQKWWLAPLLSNMTDGVLYLGAVGLTSITDNAALTYLGGQVEGLSEASRYALVAGALAGGGLTIIANAPNAAGYSILSGRFADGLNPFKLLLAAVIPTCVAITCLWFL